MSPWRKVKPSDVLPIFTTHHSDTATLLLTSTMSRLGITDLKSYLERLKLPIVICTVLGALIGAGRYQFMGLVSGALAGMVAPAAAIWICVTLFVVALYMFVFCAVWAVIIWVLWWILHS